MNLGPLASSMNYLLERLFDLTGHPVVAILLLSVCVKLILLVPVRISERLQKKVNEDRSRVEPVLRGLKAKYSGEELHRKTLEAYRELRIHPAHTLRSLLGPAIQIPFFFAAFHALEHSPIFAGVSFLWIENLAEPDALFALPLELPWFGSSFNALPFLMTGLTLIASGIAEQEGLSQELLGKQRKALYLLALFFFVLLYPFAAAMVIYWTMNNLLSVVQAFLERLAAKRRAVCVFPQPAK
jgi:YidC/Oxa1 family membrane protein insertase